MRLWLILFLTVWIFGFISGFWDNRLDALRCEFGEEVVGRIVEPVRLGRESVQYVIRPHDAPSCLVLVTAMRWPSFLKGDELRVVGEVNLLSEISTEYIGYAEYLARRGIVGTMSFAEVELISASPSLDAKMRRTIITHAQKIFLEPSGSFILAMLLGQRGLVSDEIQDSFRKAGISHVLAISGMHVSLLVGMIIYALIWLPGPGWLRGLAGLCVLWLYIWLIGVPVSAVRAALFWSIGIGLRFTQRLASLPTLILLTSFILVIYNPVILLDVGFQLSFAAVIGIGVMIFLSRGTEKLPRGGWRGALVLSVLITVGATLATGPLVMYHFGAVSLIGLIGNLLVVPLVPLVLALAILALLLGFVLMPMGMLLAWVADMLLRWILIVAEQLASLTWLYKEDIEISIGFVIAWYVVLIVCVLYIAWQQERTWYEIWE